MKKFVNVMIVPALLFVVGLVLFLWWVSYDPAVEIAERVPGCDGAPQEALVEEGPVKLVGQLVKGQGKASDLDGAWPRFRGANFDGISSDEVKLSRQWVADGPEVIWSMDVGEGYAGAAVLGGRVYVMDYDQEEGADTLRCVSLDDAGEIWRYSYPIKLKRWHGMSRTVPAVTEKYVVVMGPKCHVTCLDSVTGEFKWMLNLVREYGATTPQWYTGQCPLIEDGIAIIAPSGDVMMLAVDCQTGEILWESENPHGSKMTHSSIIPMEFAGRRMYVYCGTKGVVGVSAKDGEVLWETTEWKMRTVVPSPVVIEGGRILLSAGYNQGSMMLQLFEEAGRISVRKVFRLEPEVFGADQQSPIYYDGYIYSVRPDEQLVCMDLVGNIVWTSTSANKFGLGPFTIADGLIYVMNDSGLLSLVEATPTGYSQLGRAKIFEGVESWGPMAIAGEKLILRDLTRMLCLDVSGR
jgi:outer membrane protein assembly factor BamB